MKSILSHGADPAAAAELTRKVNAELNEIENTF